MAEQVQAVLDQMVAPLRDLMDRGIFSEAEIRSIVSRRRASEYLLRRRAARKADFLRYIEAEVALERLRSLRRKKVLARQEREERQRRKKRVKSSDDDDERNRGAKNSHIGDAHVVQHVHFIYVRMLRKFRDDVDLHFSHAAFARKAKSFNRLGRIYAEALQVHPRHAGLWIEAASHEFFGYKTEEGDDDGAGEGGGGTIGGGSIKNARVLMQRGLRVNETSEELWLQYFALELHYVQKLRGRREILQLGLKPTGKSGRFDDDEDEDDEAAAPSATELVPCRIIYKNAIKAIPESVKFRLRFVDLCRMFPATEAIERDIMSSIGRDFGQNAEAWIARASYAAEREENGEQEEEEEENATLSPRGFLLANHADTNDDEESEDGSGNTDEKLPKKRKLADGSSAVYSYGANDASLRILAEATDHVQTPEMLVESVRFVRSRIGQILDDAEERHVGTMGDSISDEGTAAVARHAEFLGALFEKAEGKGLVSPDLVLEKSHYYIHTGEPIRAEAVLRAAATSAPKDDDKCSHDARVWLKWAEVAHRLQESALSKECANFISATDILRRALKNIPIHEGRSHMQVLVELMRRLLLLSTSKRQTKSKLGERRRHDEIASLFQRIIILSQGSDLQSSVTTSVLPDVVVPEICLQYLQHSLMMGSMAETRTIYETVLFQSSYGKSCAGKSHDEIRAMKNFFDACICIEKAVGRTLKIASTNKSMSLKQERQASRVRLGRIYDAVILFFRNGDGLNAAEEYRKRRDDDIAYS